MNEGYARKSEEACFKLLLDFNSKLKLNDLEQLEERSTFDASGHTEDGRYIELELKRRFINHDAYDTIIIEPYKLQYAKEHQDAIELYVNFTNDECAIVFNLHNVGNVTKSQYDITSGLYERTKTSNRYELPLKSAWIYQKQNNKYKLIQKGW